MKKIIRLTESDLHSLVQRSVLRILREQDDNLLLQLIAQNLVQQQPTITPGKNENVEIQLQGDTLAFLDFVVDSNPYMRQGMKSSSYDVPDDPDEIIDNPTIEVLEIAVCEDGECRPIQDNGIIKQTLENNIKKKNVKIDYYGRDIPSEQDYFSEY